MSAGGVGGAAEAARDRLREAAARVEDAAAAVAAAGDGQERTDAVDEALRAAEELTAALPPVLEQIED